MESDSGESTGGIIDLSQLSKLSAASPAVLYSTQQTSHDATSGQGNQGEDHGGCEGRETMSVDGKDVPTHPPTCWQEENPLTILSSSREFSLIEDEKFDFLIPDEYLDESLDGSCGGRHKDSIDRTGGISACSSPIHQAGCLKQSIYDNALLQLRHRGRADLVLNQQQQHKVREKEGERECDVGALYRSTAVDALEGIASEHTQADTLQEEAGALRNASSFTKEDNLHCQADNSPAVLLIDLGASPSSPPPRLNNTQTLDVSTDLGHETEVLCCPRNTTFTLNECLLEGSSTVVTGDANSGNNSASEEEGQKPTRLPTLAKRTQASLLNASVTVQHSDYAIMRDVWKEQMQAEPVLVSDGGSSVTCGLAPKAGANTATNQPHVTAERTISASVEVGCPSSTFVKEQQESSPEKPPSSPPDEVPEHNTTKTLGTGGPSDAASLLAPERLRPPAAAHPQLTHPKGMSQPKGKSQLSAAHKRQTKWTEKPQHEPTSAVSVKGSQGHTLSAAPSRGKSILKPLRRPLPSHTKATLVSDSSSVARSASNPARGQQERNTPVSLDDGAKENQHRTISLHKEAPPPYMSAHYQSTPKCLSQPIPAVQPNFSLSSIEGSDPAHRIPTAQKTTTPRSQSRRRSGIPTSTSLDKATSRSMSAQKTHRIRQPDPSLSPQLPKPPPMQKALHQPKTIPRIALHDKNTSSATVRGPVAPGKTKAVRAVVSQGAENRRRSRLAVPGHRGDSAT